MPLRGLGLAWRPELARITSDRPDLRFVELLADRYGPGYDLPWEIESLRASGTSVVLHSVGLSLGSAEVPDRKRLRHLASLAEQLDSPVVSDHIAFVRAGRFGSGHLLPVPCTKDALQVMVENVRIAQSELPAPLAMEPIASLVEWPEPEIDCAAFICELLDRTGAMLLLDVANVYANGRNHGFDPLGFIDRLPLERLAYVHVAGGTVGEGLYHDTHTHPVPSPVIDLVGALAERVGEAGFMLERDGRFPPPAQLHAELSAIANAARIGAG